MANPNPTKTGAQANPNGRPKAAWTWSGLLREVAEKIENGSEKTKKELIAEALTREAAKGNVAAIKEFGDRIDGKAKQNLGLGEDGGKVTITIEDYGSKDNTST